MFPMSYIEYIYSVHCSICCSLAISSSGKSVTRSKKVSIPKNIRKTEQNRRNKNIGTKSGTTIVREFYNQRTVHRDIFFFLCEPSCCVITRSDIYYRINRLQPSILRPYNSGILHFNPL